MSTTYKATMPDVGYFITITTVEWIDIFTRVRQKYVIIDSLHYCQHNKGLEIYSYYFIQSHVHILCNAVRECVLSKIIRDFKKCTSKKSITK